MTQREDVLQDQWFGCYDDSWKGIIPDVAFAHPAKFSRNLIRRIYEHVIAEQWVEPGSTVIDPFGGIALGAYDAMQLGLHWTGVELESKFNRLGGGYDCPGFTSAQWRYYKARAEYDARAPELSPYARFWCWVLLRKNTTPVNVADLCVYCAEAIKSEAEENKQVHLFALTGNVDPSREPHHFDGNLDLWRRRAFSGTGRLIQGDSRKLLEVLSESRLSENRHNLNSQDLSMASPPYWKDRNHSENSERTPDHVRSRLSKSDLEGRRYGNSEGQLGEMSSGDHDVAISSPPYVSGGHHNDIMGAWNANGRGQGVSKAEAGYGASEGQMGQMREGEHDLAVVSPPYGNTVKVRSSENDDQRCADKGLDPACYGRGHDGRVYSEQYGAEEGQLGNMQSTETGHQMAISSPPYGQRTIHGQSGIDWEKAKRSTVGQGGQHGAPGAGLDEQYGDSEGQLSRLPANEDSHNLAISSPPYARSLMPDMNDPDKYAASEARYRENHPEHKRPKNAAMIYGNTEGNLGHMPVGHVDSVISSPPYGGISDKHDRTGAERAARRHEEKGFNQGSGCFKSNEAYGRTDGQLGGMDDDQFDAAIGSPPFLEGRSVSRVQSDVIAEQQVSSGYEHRNESYGASEGQIGAMPAGKLEEHLQQREVEFREWLNGPDFTVNPSENLDVAVSSPPYNLPMSQDHNSNRGGNRGTSPSEKGAFVKYGNTEGQIEGMSASPEQFNAAISSPPYAQPHSAGGGINTEGYAKDWQVNDIRDMVGRRTYQARGGDRVEGNLETLPTGDVDAVLSETSLFCEGCDEYLGNNNSPITEGPHAGARPTDLTIYCKQTKRKERVVKAHFKRADASISSPPYEKSDVTSDRNFIGGGGRQTAAAELEHGYSESEANLGNLPKGDFEQSVTSPPYEHDTEPHGDLRPDVGRQRVEFVDRNYGSKDNCSALRGEDFWSASRLILEQLFIVLRPGGHACFVTKRFVRDGAIVDFSQQWIQLCEAVGFRLVHHHKAMLTQHHGDQHTLDGDVDAKTTEKKSFFRRLAEKKGSPRIDWEDVTCFVRP